MRQADKDANIGRILDGKYELTELLGQGGMGEVYAAVHKLIGRKVAVKLLKEKYASDAELLERFQQEARTAAAVGSDHIVEILDMNNTDGGEFFIVMEFLDGVDLASLIRRSGKLPFERACHIMIQMLSAIQAVHDRGIIHRDLKPANIMLTSRGAQSDFVKLVDFGISKIRDDENYRSRGLTRTGELLGTPGYMSPEQAMGCKDITPSTDIYAAGAVLYEMLTGSTPFSGDSLLSLLVKIKHEKPIDPRKSNPGLHPILSDSVNKALGKTPEERFVSAEEFRDVLLPFSPGTAADAGLAVKGSLKKPLSLIPPPERSDSADGSDISRHSRKTPLDISVPTTLRRGKRSRALIGLAAGGTAILALLIAIALVVPNQKKVEYTIPIMATPPLTPLADGEAKPNQARVSAPSSAANSAPTGVVQLHLVIEPSYAEVYIDGVRRGLGSLITSVSRDDRRHTITVHAPGYHSFEEQVRYDKYLIRTIILKKK